METDQNGLYYMRARYYNTDIKRFLNRDILTGSIENSQSLNQYSYVQGNPVNLSDPFGLCPEGGGTENVRNLLGHTVLDILGFVPLIGFVFDIANCIWYATEGKGLMAAASFIAAIPGAGGLVGLGIKALGKGSKAIQTARAVSTTFRMAGAIGQTGLAAINLGIAIDAVVNEYQLSYNGRVSTLSLVNLGASVLGVAIGIHSSKKSIREFKSMWNGMRKIGGSGNYVCRALNQKDYERYTNGLGLEAKNPNGNWNLKEHLVNGSGKASWANDPYISTTSDLSIAREFNQSGSGYGIVKIDMDKVASASYKGYEIYPRVNGVEGLPYHYSVWQQETSVYQSIPFEAIVDYFH